MEPESDADTNCKWGAQYSHQRIGTSTGWLGLVGFGFHGISTFVGYLTPNPFLCKWSVLFKIIQFSISTQFNCQKTFLFQIIPAVICNNSVKCKYSLKVGKQFYFK